MPSKPADPRWRLLHIRDNIIYTQQLLADVAYDDFRKSRTLFYATALRSKSSRKRPDAFRD
jgi:hypothetical protein